MSYSIKARKQKFIKSYGFLSLVEDINKNISSKCGQWRFNQTKKSTSE